MVGLTLSSHGPQQWLLASLVVPDFFLSSLGCSASHPSALRLACCLRAANHSPLPKPDLRLEPQYPAPLVGAFEVRVCRSAQTDRAGLSLLCPLHTCHHALRLRRSPSVPTDLPASKETFPLSQLPPRATGPVLIPSSLFFFCLTQLHGDFLALLEV